MQRFESAYLQLTEAIINSLQLHNADNIKD